MNIIFPAYPGSLNKTDPSWETEVRAAQEVGFKISFLSEGYFGSALSLFNYPENDALYRGWILKPSVYKEISDQIPKLLNSYENYLWSYELPQWYCNFAFYHTPKSVVVDKKVIIDPFDQKLLDVGLSLVTKFANKDFDGRPIIIKDYLKSRKHEWHDACFIRDSSDKNEVLRVVKNFINLQGEDFYGGIIMREFIQLKQIGVHPKSHMPLALEFRVFFLNQEPIFTTPYWTDGAVYPEDITSPPTEWLIEMGKKIKSPFVALDIAQDEDGTWWVIEVNDGGSAGLPDHADPKKFYEALFERLDNGEI